MKTWVVFSALVCVLTSGFASEIKIKTLTDLEMVEPWDTHLVHGDRVWVGKVQVGSVATHRVEIYNTQGTLEQTIELPFVPRKIFALGKEGALVTGTTSTPHWKSHYAEITKNAGKYSLTKTYTFAEEYMVDYFAEIGTTKFFNNQGDREIIRSNGKAWEPVNKTEIIGPSEMVPVGGALYVINVADIIHNLSYLSRVDIATGKVEPVLKQYRVNLKNLTLLKNGLLAVAETGNDKLMIFDPKTDTVVNEIALSPGEPRAVAELGHCVAVGLADARVVAFFDENTLNEVARWDLSIAGTKFRKINKMGFDEKTGRLFARSNYICSGCEETMSSVIMAEEVGESTFKACTK